MTGMDLVEFVTARLDEREALALAAQGEEAETNTSREGWLFLMATRPAHVLREVAAMRAIVADAVQVPTISMRHVVRILAAIWSEHEDYRTDWAV